MVFIVSFLSGALMIEWWLWLICSFFIFVAGTLIVRFFREGMDEDDFTLSFTFIMLLSVTGPIGIGVLVLGGIVFILFCFFIFLTGRSFIPDWAKEYWREYARRRTK